MEAIAICWNVLLAILAVVLFTAATRDQRSEARDKQLAWTAGALILGTLLGLAAHLGSFRSLSMTDTLWVFGPLLISLPLSVSVLVISLGFFSDTEAQSSEK